MSIAFMTGICFIWIGFVAAISFMESWLKFRAPGVDLSIGLSIGRLIFKALNRIEWFCLVLIGIGTWMSGFSVAGNRIVVPAVSIAAILLLQTLIWLPRMDRRAHQVIAGEKLAPSRLHFYYVGAEFIKLGLLLYMGCMLLIVL